MPVRIVKKIFYVVTFLASFCSVRDAHAVDDFATYYIITSRLNPNVLIAYAQTYADYAEKTINNAKIYLGFNLYDQDLANEFIACYTHKVIVNGSEKIFIDIADRLYKAAECNDLYAPWQSDRHDKLSCSKWRY